MNKPKNMYINKLIKSESLRKTLHITDQRDPATGKNVRKIDVIRFDHNIQLDTGCYVYTMKTGMFSTSSSTKKDIIDIDDNSIQIKHRYSKINLDTEKNTQIVCEPLYKKNLTENKKANFASYPNAYGDKRETFGMVYLSAMRAVKTALDMNLDENYYVCTYGRIFKESPNTQVRVLASAYNPSREMLEKLQSNELDENSQIILLCTLTMYFLIKEFSIKDMEVSEYDMISREMISYFNSHQGMMSAKMVDIYLRFLKQVSKSVRIKPKDDGSGEWEDVYSEQFKFNYEVDCKMVRYQGKSIIGDKTDALKKSLIEEVQNTLGRDYRFITYTVKDRKSSIYGRNIENVVEYYIMSNLVISNNYKKCVEHLRQTLISCETIADINAIKENNKKPDYTDSTPLIQTIVDNTIYNLHADYINDFISQYKMCTNELKQANMRAYSIDIHEEYNSTNAKLIDSREGFIYYKDTSQFVDFGKTLWEHTTTENTNWLIQYNVSKLDTYSNLVYSPINYVTIRNSIIKDSDSLGYSRKNSMRTNSSDYVYLGMYEVFTEILMLLTTTYFSISYNEDDGKSNNITLDKYKLIDILTKYLEIYNNPNIYPYYSAEFRDCRKVEALIRDIEANSTVLEVNSVINSTSVDIKLKVNLFVLNNLCKFIPKIIQAVTGTNTGLNHYISTSQTKVPSELSYQVYNAVFQQIQAYYLKCAIQLNAYKSIEDYRAEYYRQMVQYGYTENDSSSYVYNILPLSYIPTKVYDSKELLDNPNVDQFDLINFIESYVKGKGFIRINDIKLFSHIERKMIRTQPTENNPNDSGFSVHDIWEPHNVELNFAVSYPEFLNLKSKMSKSIDGVYDIVLKTVDSYNNHNVRGFDYGY